ncbi:hypothetical protein KI688_005293 [Linnemannia hyalina]|uniref:Uncharacterized protein n=1 Tax=Linnemannia hyalina TaxID=64524 RepID=A0A9P8BNS8_9FUNG|nr:hypothetical protein KI688_005293 [Linnemannia hyalina]
MQILFCYPHGSKASPYKATSGQESKRPGTDRLSREMVTPIGRLTDFENQSGIANVGDFLDRFLIFRTDFSSID